MDNLEDKKEEKGVHRRDLFKAGLILGIGAILPAACSSPGVAPLLQLARLTGNRLNSPINVSLVSLKFQALEWVCRICIADTIRSCLTVLK
jgi:hypothetical protein